MAEVVPPYHIHLRSDVRLFVSCALVCIGATVISPRMFLITFGALPFAFSDYVFFAVGALGFIVIPPHLPAARPWALGISCAFVAGSFASTLFAHDQLVAMKRAVSAGLICFSAMGVSRFAGDPVIRKVFWWIVVAIWIHWVLYMVYLLLTDPYFSMAARAGRIGPLRYDRNAIGMTLGFSGSAVGGYLLAKRDRLSHGWALAVFLLTITVAMACYTRSGVLSLGVILITACVRNQTFRLRTMAAILVGMLMVTWMIFVVQAEAFNARVQGAGVRYNPLAIQYQQATTQSRWLVLKKAWYVAQEFPTVVLGVGAGGFANFHIDAEDVWKVDGLLPHNSYVTVLIEGGVITFIAWLLLVWHTVLRGADRRMLSPYDDGLVIAALSYVLGMLMLDAIGVMCWLLLAMSFGAIRAERLARMAHEGAGYSSHATTTAFAGRKFFPSTSPLF